MTGYSLRIQENDDASETHRKTAVVCTSEPGRSDPDWALIGDGLGSVYESNPVAAWCLQGYGWAGMAVFKALMVLASGGLSEVISRYRPRTGGRVLGLGCIITASVVLYSGYLYLTVPST